MNELEVIEVDAKIQEPDEKKTDEKILISIIMKFKK